jgi:hypothetical protein
MVGEVTCVHVTAIPESAEPEVKAKSTLQWVPADTAIPIEVMLLFYDIYVND